MPQDKSDIWETDKIVVVFKRLSVKILLVFYSCLFDQQHVYYVVGMILLRSTVDTNYCTVVSELKEYKEKWLNDK